MTLLEAFEEFLGPPFASNEGRLVKLPKPLLDAWRVAREELETNMRPTLGRSVHYTNLGDAAGRYAPEPHTATITKVTYAPPAAPGGMYLSDDEKHPSLENETHYKVSLHILYETGQFDMKDVPFSEVPGTPGHWNWPPRV